MENKKKHVFEVTANPVPRRRKSNSPELHRFLVRVLAPLNETLRQKAMYRGDLSEMIVKALDSVNLNSVPLVTTKWGKEDYRGMTIQVPMATRDRLVTASKNRGVSMNTLINTALVHWFAEQGEVKIKERGSRK